MSPLGQLIEDVRAAFLDRHGVVLSYDAIAKRGGGAIKGKRVHQMATQPIKNVPQRPTLEALARGLEVPYRVVLEKALDAAGLQPAQQEDRPTTEDRKIG